MTTPRVPVRGGGVLLSLAAAAIGLGAASAPAGAEDPIRIGDLNSYSTFAAFTLPYRNGLHLAVDEVNAAGGVLGRKLELISRDDGGNPGQAVTVANELLSRERAHLLVGTILSNIGLAVADVAHQKKAMFLASEPLTDAIAWEKGNPFTFRLRPGTYVQSAMLAEEAAKLPAKRWVTIAPNYEYGQSAVKAFKALLRERRPDVEFVAEQWPALGKIDAGPTVQALALAEPEAIFNVTFGADLTKFVREGNLRGLFRGRPVVSLLTGEPEWGDPLKDEMPAGWIVTGYPFDQLETPAHVAFRTAYEARFKDYPRMGSVVGYVTVKTVAKAIAKAGSTDTEALIRAMRGLSLDTPFGPITFRASDQQSTMGTFLGRTTVRGGMGRMTDWRFADGATYLPGPEKVKELRPGG
ncbi:MAG: ABC transporter substrate-binding protein [Proteobacteria bacterium]|nr:ABC transporter substrate-binding protein [Pseudomonadota bacterium]